MTVFFKTLTGETIVLEVEPNETIDNIRIKLSEKKIEWNPNYIKIIWAGKELIDNIPSQAIKDGTLHAIYRPEETIENQKELMIKHSERLIIEIGHLNQQANKLDKQAETNNDEKLKEEANKIRQKIERRKLTIDSLLN